MRNLDVLRAVAVLAVFFAHLSRDVLGIDAVAGIPIGEAGRAGVFLFFVHTSLVLLLSLERMPGWTAASFYVRRAFRIYPLSIACVLLVYALAIPFEPMARFEPISPLRLAANLALMQNVVPGGKEVIAPLWSLSWEVQMYLVLPLLYLALRRRLGTAHVLALWLITAILGGPSWGDGPLRALRLLQYVPCFLGGALAFRLLLRPRARLLPAALWPLIATGSVVLYTIAQHVIPAPANIGTKYVLCLALGALIPRVADLPESVLTRAGHTIAKYSYGIYLAHFPVMWLVFARLELHPAARWTLFAMLMIAAPALAYHAIEEPLIRAGKRLAERFERPHPPVAPPPQLDMAEAPPP